jgi:Tol biopolymer transport system component
MPYLPCFAPFRRVLALALPVVALSAAPAAAQNPITRASVGPAGNEGKKDSGALSRPAFSRDGRFLAFDSNAGNLVGGDSNGVADVFVKELATGALVRVSVASNGTQGDRDSAGPSLSGDGRFVAFHSFATNLVSGDTNKSVDVFLHDRDPDGNGIFDEGNGVTTCVSVSSGGTLGNSQSLGAAISDDGRYVAFQSSSTNLVAGDTNQRTDVFLRDVVAGTTIAISVDVTGTTLANDWCYLPVISGDGALVAFPSSASNLVAGDTNGWLDVFVRDWGAGTTVRASVDSAGVEGNGESYDPSLSGDGSVVVFTSWATNLVPIDVNGMFDVFVHEVATGVTSLVSIDSNANQGNSNSFRPWLSSDGSVVAFESWADDFAAGDQNNQSDVFVHERAAAVTTCVSFNGVGLGCNGTGSHFPCISGDATKIAFVADSDNLVVADGNAKSDVFVHDRTVVPRAASWSSYGSGFYGTSFVPSITPSADPAFGASFTLDISNSFGSPTFGLLFVGASPASIPTKKGGTLLVQWAAIFGVPFGSGGTSLPVTVPFDLALCGIDAYLQIVEADPGAQFGFSFSPGLDLSLGL